MESRSVQIYVSKEKGEHEILLHSLHPVLSAAVP
jgi:hypothetical protein